MSVSAPVEGRLFMYGDDPTKKMAVFMTGSRKRAFVVVGGQTDNFFSLLFMQQIIPELDANDWTTVQVQLSSSCAGYGGRTHVGDAEDLDQLVAKLTGQFDMSEITLYAWSSGVQVALEFLATGDNAEAITRVILHGVIGDPASDVFLASTKAKRDACVQEMVASGRKQEFVPDHLYDIPLTAARLSTGGYPSIQEALWNPAVSGDAKFLAAALACIKVPLFLQVALSTCYEPTAATKDEFCKMVRTCASTPEIEIAFSEGAGDERRRHLRGSESQHTAAVVMFLKDCDRRRSEREEAARQFAAEEMRRSRSILAKSLLKASV